MSTPEKWKIIKECWITNYELSDEECAAILSNKGSGSRTQQINKKIRTDTLSNEEKKYCLDLQTALNKLPSTKNAVIYRHLNFDGLKYERAQEFFTENLKKVIKFREFQSCTLRKCFTGTPEHYNWTIKITPSVNGAAKDIYTFYEMIEDQHDPEQEVCVLNDTCFKILSVNFFSDIKVCLQEIPCDSPSTIVPEF